MKDTDIVIWNDSYATGIELLDNQHRELVKLTNELYRACLEGNDAAGAAFAEVMRRMVEYVRYHFTVELEILKRINYPSYNDHKKQHDTLVMRILDASKEYSDGRKMAPNNFVRTLKDWVFGHIAFYDKSYTSYVAEQKKKDPLIAGQIAG